MHRKGGKGLADDRKMSDASWHRFYIQLKAGKSMKSDEKCKILKNKNKKQNNSVKIL